MFAVTRPGMGTGDSLDLGGVLPRSRGTKIFLLRTAGGKNCSFAGNLRQFKPWRMCDEAPDQEFDQRGARMSKLPHRSEAFLWTMSISQAVAMLVFNLSLWAAVS